MKWPTVAVGEIAQQVRGVSYDKSQVSNSAAPGMRPVLRAGNIQEGKLLLNRDLVYVPDSCIAHQQLLRPGDIVIAASSGSIDVVGKAAQLSEPWEGSFGAFCKVVRPSSDRVNPRYLHHYFQSTGYRRKVSSLAAGANINNLKNEHIDDLLLPLPPLEEQRRIAAILDKASKAKELSDTAEKLAKVLRVSLFEEMLGSKVWPTAFVGDVVCRLTNGYVGPTRDIYVEEGVPYLLARHVKEGRLLYDRKTRVSVAFNNKNKKSILAEGDVLLVQSGHIGSSCVVPREHAGHNCHAMIVITPDHQVLTGDYLSALFETPRMQRAFKGIQTGITVPHLNCRDVRKMEIPIPPLESQHELSRRLSALSKNASMLQDRRKQLESLTKSLGSNFFHDALQ